jgi:hypothetical protein
MLAPVYLGLCTGSSASTVWPAIEEGHEATSDLMYSGIARSIAVSAIHTVAMAVAGGAMAWIVYRWAGLTLLRRAWLNLESVWAVGLIVTGVVSCAL